MNRRNFIRGLLTAAAGFTILPGAGRIWKAEAKVIPAKPKLIARINPAYENAQFEIGFIVSPNSYGAVPFLNPTAGMPSRITKIPKGYDPELQRVPGASSVFDPWPRRFNVPVDITDRQAMLQASIPPVILEEVVDQDGVWK